jgi:hypothetical protein
MAWRHEDLGGHHGSRSCRLPSGQKTLIGQIVIDGALRRRDDVSSGGLLQRQPVHARLFLATSLSGPVAAVQALLHAARSSGYEGRAGD